MFFTLTIVLLTTTGGGGSVSRHLRPDQRSSLKTTEELDMTNHALEGRFLQMVPASKIFLPNDTKFTRKLNFVSRREPDLKRPYDKVNTESEELNSLKMENKSSNNDKKEQFSSTGKEFTNSTFKRRNTNIKSVLNDSKLLAYTGNNSRLSLISMNSKLVSSNGHLVKGTDVPPTFDPVTETHNVDKRVKTSVNPIDAGKIRLSLLSNSTGNDGLKTKVNSLKQTLRGRFLDGHQRKHFQLMRLKRRQRNVVSPMEEDALPRYRPVLIRKRQPAASRNFQTPLELMSLMSLPPVLFFHPKKGQKLAEHQVARLGRRMVKKSGGQVPVFEVARNIHKRRRYDVPQIECPPTTDGTERFSCPSPDRMGRYKCILDHAMCDGFIDCPNAEDEDRMSCMFYQTTKAHLDVLADALLRWARGRY